MQLGDKAKQSVFAGMVGVSQQAVSKQFGNGVLEKEGTYADWLIAYCEHLRIEASGRDVAEDIKSATIREKNANADKKELETDILRGTVVNMDQVYEELMPAIQHIKSVLSSGCEKIKSSIDAVYEINVDKRYIDDPIFNAMSEIAQYEAKCPASSDDAIANDGATSKVKISRMG